MYLFCVLLNLSLGIRLNMPAIYEIDLLPEEELSVLIPFKISILFHQPTEGYETPRDLISMTEEIKLNLETSLIAVPSEQEPTTSALQECLKNLNIHVPASIKNTKKSDLLIYVIESYRPQDPNSIYAHTCQTDPNTGNVLSKVFVLNIDLSIEDLKYVLEEAFDNIIDEIQSSTRLLVRCLPGYAHISNLRCGKLTPGCLKYNLRRRCTRCEDKFLLIQGKCIRKYNKNNQLRKWAIVRLQGKGRKLKLRLIQKCRDYYNNGKCKKCYKGYLLRNNNCLSKSKDCFHLSDLSAWTEENYSNKTSGTDRLSCKRSTCLRNKLFAQYHDLSNQYKFLKDIGFSSEVLGKYICVHDKMCKTRIDGYNLKHFNRNISISIR